MDTLGRPPRARWRAGALTALVATFALASCAKLRDRAGAEGIHDEGWADPESSAFHAKWFQGRQKAHGDEIEQIADCRKCHGEDYGGGSVGVSCKSSGCHTQKGGPEFCGTCHGSDKGPMPVSGPALGAHAMHKAFCTDCHAIPDKLAAPGHVDGTIDIVFSGLAAAGPKAPSWDAGKRTCADVYCHLSTTPEWKTPTADAPCDSCHKAPPDSHARWSHVATDTSCASCHPSPAKPTVNAEHIDTKVELSSSITCWSCHGSPPNGAPAPALDGSTDPSSPGVGAHQRHLDAALAGRIGKVVSCQTCHPVPTSLDSPGHYLDAQGNLDTTPEVDLHLPNGGPFDMPGSWDATNRTCTVWCHFNKPSPAWTSDKGGTPKCDSCHGFPPYYTRNGDIHTQSAPLLGECVKCHVYDPATHVDGTLNYQQKPSWP